MTYIGLKPKSSHTFKYSQPLELVLFHVIEIRIKSLKGFYYPHLLNNYLINYLNFLGLTLMSFIQEHLPQYPTPGYTHPLSKAQDVVLTHPEIFSLLGVQVTNYLL